MSEESSSQSYTRRVIEAHTIQSSHLNEERTMKVFLPPGYEEDSSRLYPVMYCHDGLEFFTHGRIATIATQMMGEGKLSPIIIVGIAVQLSTRVEDYSPNGGRHEAYTKFVTEECMPFIEERYRVLGDLRNRWMAGISLGAAATLSMQMQRPDLFHQLLLFSGAFYEYSQQTVELTASMEDVTAYMIVGEQETEVKTSMGPYDFLALNRSMRELLEDRGANLSYREAEGTHIWGFWQRELPAALAFVQQTMSMS